MNINKAKELLKNKGYCSFNIKDFNKDYYTYLLDNLKCNDTNNFRTLCRLVRINYSNKNTIYNIQTEFKTYNEGVEYVSSIIDNPDNNINQIWFEAGHPNVLINNGYTSTLAKTLPEIFSSITREFYDLDPHKNLQNQISFTLYSDGCLLSRHSDGGSNGRICAVLIYLNETYNESNGGILVLGDEYTVIPEIGNVAIIDLMKYDTPHMVTKVIGGIGRYAILSFIYIGD